MIGKLKVCAFIPAKAVSKRIPGKNLKLLAGKPMLAYIIETVKKAEGVDRVVVSTESEDVRRVAERYGAEVIMRPVELTKDETTTHEVLMHTVRALKAQGYVPDYMMILYATSPLLKTERIEEAIRIARERDSNCVVSGSYHKGHFWKEAREGGAWKRFYPLKLVNSQWQKPLFVENGAITMGKTATLKDNMTVRTADVLVMEPGENIDVDYPEDFAEVERRLKAQ